MEKAKALIGPGRDKILFDLVVRFAGESLEVVHSLLTPLPPLVQPAGAALRGGRAEQPPEPLRMEKVLNGFVVELEISSPGEDTWNIHLILKKAEDQEPLHGLRVTLKDLGKQRERQSLLVDKGIVSFLELSNGEYAVEIKDKGIVLGELSFCLAKS